MNSIEGKDLCTAEHMIAADMEYAVYEGADATAGENPSSKRKRKAERVKSV
jgi:hypothetical protein